MMLGFWLLVEMITNFKVLQGYLSTGQVGILIKLVEFFFLRLVPLEILSIIFLVLGCMCIFCLGVGRGEDHQQFLTLNNGGRSIT